MSVLAERAVGTPLDRVEGEAKVTGEALYAFEHPLDGPAYGALVQSTVASGEIRALDASDALRVQGVLVVISHENAPRLQAEGELAVLQSPRVCYRGQIVAAVVADTLEAAREAARLVRVDYAEEPPDVVLRDDHPKLYRPDKVNPAFETDTAQGDLDAGLSAAEHVVDAVYETPAFHNNAMEPHATIAVWADGRLTLYDSTQGASSAGRTIAGVFGLDPERVRVVSPHVGGGFGSKGMPRPHAVVAVIGAMSTGRAVKLAVTRQQMFALTGYRTPTIQRIRLGADRDGRLLAIAHDVVEQTSTVQEFAEQTAVVTRMMYAAPNRRTTHRLAPLNVPTPSWMRAPGECPGMFALESAIDELAVACGVDPIELRARNDPEVDPENGRRFSSRNLVECLRTGAERFGWADRDPAPATRRDGRWLYGTGVAASTYPVYRRPCRALARRRADGGYLVRVAAADIGTGARTALTQIAADTLGVPPADVQVELGDSAFPAAPVAGGSAGTASWGTAVEKACRLLRDGNGETEVSVDTTPEIEAAEQLSRHAFGAQFVEVRVDLETGEIRVPRVLGVFAAGTIVNPKTARSQLIGGMTMGLGMALLEESILDRRYGDYLNRDLAGYHLPTYADLDEIDAIWVEEEDPDLNPIGSKGIGEIGIVGTAAAVANAVYHATGHRHRRLPITPAAVLEG
jgi:xanthine dehydrogenase YagR molybdenum-binding subunit